MIEVASIKTPKLSLVPEKGGFLVFKALPDTRLSMSVSPYCCLRSRL